MPKIRVLSADDILAIFKLFGFNIVSQKGSHIKLVRFVGSVKQVLIVPNHKEIDKGTTKAIFKQASAFINEQELYGYFHH